MYKIEGNSPDWDENDADLWVPGGSRMSRYLDTIRTEMKYNSAKERNWACLVSSTSLEEADIFHFSFQQVIKANSQRMQKKKLPLYRYKSFGLKTVLYVLKSPTRPTSL